MRYHCSRPATQPGASAGAPRRKHAASCVPSTTSRIRSRPPPDSRRGQTRHRSVCASQYCTCASRARSCLSLCAPAPSARQTLRSSTVDARGGHRLLSTARFLQFELSAVACAPGPVPRGQIRCAALVRDEASQVRATLQRGRVKWNGGEELRRPAKVIAQHSGFARSGRGAVWKAGAACSGAAEQLHCRQLSSAPVLGMCKKIQNLQTQSVNLEGRV